MEYFSINPVSQKMQLREAQGDAKAEIDDFVPAIYQGSLDVVAAVNQLDEKGINALYDFVITRTDNSPDIMPPHLVELGDKEFSITRFIKCGILQDNGRYSALSVDEVGNPKKIKLVEPKNNARVYFSNVLDTTVKEKLVLAKADRPPANKDFSQFDGCKMTFMVESTIYYNGKNEVYDKPLPINIFNFCYPKFNDYRLNSQTNQEGDRRKINGALKEMMKINLLAIIYEAQKQGKPLPFIIPSPGAFFVDLDDNEKKNYMGMISQAINQVARNYEPLVKKYISEFILLGKDQWQSSSFEERAEIKFHKVDSDMIEIADKLRSQGIICPIPMMAHPSHKIGNGYANYFKTTPVDELLARASGNSHGITFSKSVLDKDHNLKDIEIDPTFKTLKPVHFSKSGLDGNESYFQQSDEDESGQHIIRVEGSQIEKSDDIDVAPMFSLAIKEAAKGLDLFEGFEDDEIKARKLKFLLDFAKDNKGVGNKIVDLENKLNTKGEEVTSMTSNEDIVGGNDFIKKFCSQAKTFSYRFQNTMNEFGIKTGNQDASDAKKKVGARLHRMANEENIYELFKNTALHQSQAKVRSDQVAMQEARGGETWAEGARRRGGGGEVRGAAAGREGRGGGGGRS
jgi:hypothetical protein